MGKIERVYREIIFNDNMKLSEKEFIEQYKNHFVFKRILPKERTKELKKAHKIATKGNL